MNDLKKKFPGTVVGVVSKSDPNFRESFKEALDEDVKQINKPLHEKLEDKVAAHGSAVVCCRPDGFVVEGNVEMILPWGAEWIDPDWRDATVVVKDHESGVVSNWRPEYVTFIGNKVK